MTAEDWRPVVGFPDYAVSNLGRVVSYKGKKPREMRGGRNQRGYRLVVLQSPDGKAVCRSVHRLVAAAFIGPLPEGMQTRHLDGDKNNNSVLNLSYCTPSQNILDQVAHGSHYYANRTHCPREHPYTPDNTYVIPSTGGRMCRTCMRERYQRSAFRAAGIAA